MQMEVTELPIQFLRHAFYDPSDILSSLSHLSIHDYHDYSFGD
jgi:hypothetical protein